MIISILGTPYVPGTYARKRPEAEKVASQYVQEWEARRQKTAQKKPKTNEIRPCICFSRKIGVGALEVADLLARKIHLRVADREILEHMSRRLEPGARDDRVLRRDVPRPRSRDVRAALRRESPS